MATLIAGLVMAAFLNGASWRGEAPRTRPIAEIRVGQRVVTDAPAEALAAAERDPHLQAAEAPEVDPATWRLVRLRAELRHPDGMPQSIHVRTLQSPEWLAAHDVRVGRWVPLPLNLIEMGLPEDLKARVLAVEACPPLESGPGRLVVTTVNQRSDDVHELTIRGSDAGEHTIRTTGGHPFYSLTHATWRDAAQLRPGELLDTLAGSCPFSQATEI